MRYRSLFPEEGSAAAAAAAAEEEEEAEEGAEAAGSSSSGSASSSSSSSSASTGSASASSSSRASSSSLFIGTACSAPTEIRGPLKGDWLVVTDVHSSSRAAVAARGAELVRSPVSIRLSEAAEAKALARQAPWHTVKREILAASLALHQQRRRRVAQAAKLAAEAKAAAAQAAAAAAEAGKKA